MKNYHQLFAYADYHKKKVTLVSHLIGVPLIILAIQMCLSWGHVAFAGGTVTFAWVLFTVISLYYLFLDISLAYLTVLFLLGITSLASYLATVSFNMKALLIAIVLFVIGWLAQLLGHYFEGNRPAFLQNMQHILIAPLFLTAEIRSIIRRGEDDLTNRPGN